MIKNERRALVGGKAPGEANGQRVGIEQMIVLDKAALAGFRIINQSASGKVDQLAAQAASQRPEFLVGNKIRIFSLGPKLRVVDVLKKLWPISHSTLPKSAGGGAHPAQRMNSIGDVTDGHLINRHIIFLLPHFAAHFSV